MISIRNIKLKRTYQYM